MEDVSLLKSVLKQGDNSILECYNLFSGVELSMRSFLLFMTKLDLRVAYLTVPVDKKSRIYLHSFGRVYSTNSLGSLSVSLLQAEFSPKQ